MSVRKRKWTTRSGEAKEAWIVDYVDQQGERHIKTFDKKKDADSFRDSVGVDVREGVHTPENKSITVAQAADDWLAYVELEGRERSTVTQYRQHVTQHIVPRIGNEKLARLTTPSINAFRDTLLRELSRPLARKVLVSLKALLKDAKRRGNIKQNPAAEVTISTDKRGRAKLKIGVDIPTPEEIKLIVGAAKGRWRPFVLTAIFTGLRSSELRGLSWQDIDLKKGELHVRQRADRWNTIGAPKSETSERTIPLGPFVLNTLREWKLVCPKGELGLVFPNGSGNAENHGNFVKRGMWPTLIAAGVTAGGLAKYTGLHSLRHFYASWCINRKEDGGLGLDLKTVQARMGHSTLAMTADTYGHLFPRRDDGAELASAERALLG